MRRRPVLLLFCFFLLVGVGLSRVGRYRDIFQNVCDLTGAHYYENGPVLDDWLRTCETRAASLPLRTNTEQLLRAIDDQLSQLRTSHLGIYSPAEDRKLWKGESVDTGVRSRYVDGHLIVYRILKQSSAERAGVRVGDEILALPEIDQPSPWGSEHRAGIFEFSRRGQELSVEVHPTPLQIDESPRLESLSGGVGRLEIPSFRGEFFEKEAWLRLGARLSKYNRLILDLRENAGGNFVAMLRALSLFQCGVEDVGRIVQPRRSGPEKDHFDDEVDDFHQIGELDHYQSLRLKTFSGYGCYRRPVTVLVGPGTASVAEIFADAMSRRPGTRVWGQPTAGNVILAVWYDVPALGPGFSLSIPEAIYLNRSGKNLEGVGVRPARELYYDLKRALLGRDSWIEDSLRAFGG